MTGGVVGRDGLREAVARVLVDVERLSADLRAAQAELAKALPTANGGQRAEQRYGQAYQALVKVGAAPQLRRKYRA